MTHLSPRCPVGFSFEWNGDDPDAAPTRYAFAGRRPNSTLPEFEFVEHAERARIWSPRLESAAQSAYLHSLSDGGHASPGSTATPTDSFQPGRALSALAHAALVNRIA